MTKKEKKERLAAIVEALKAVYPEAVCSLEYVGDPWRISTATSSTLPVTQRTNLLCVKGGR